MSCQRAGGSLEVAVEYGFETHAGFTRAFKRAFGSPPSLYCLHVPACPPERAAVYSVRLKQEAMNMQVQIKEIQPFDIVGYAIAPPAAGRREHFRHPGLLGEDQSGIRGGAYHAARHLPAVAPLRGRGLF